MARTKVKLQFITNTAARRSTLRRRQRNLLKKVNEISILCGVDACCVIYDPEDAANIPQVWPQPEENARRILTTFYELPESERRRKMTDHLEFARARVETLKKKVARLDGENDRLEVRAILNECIEGGNINGFDFVGLTGRYMKGVIEALDELIAKVYKRISTMRPPPEAHDKEDKEAIDAGTKKVVVAPAAVAGAERGPSSGRAKGGNEFSVGGSGNIDEGSDDDSDHLSDSEEEEDDDDYDGEE